MYTIKTEISGVPVELEFFNKEGSDVTTTDMPAVQIYDGNGGFNIKPVLSSDQGLRIVSVGSENKPATTSDINKVVESVSTSNTCSIVSEVTDLLKNINAIPCKEIWQSKVIWLNVLSIAATVAAHYGFDFKAHGIDEESVATLIITVVGIINVYLRKGTDTALKTPDTQSVKNLLASGAELFSRAKK